MSEKVDMDHLDPTTKALIDADQAATKGGAP